MTDSWWPIVLVAGALPASSCATTDLERRYAAVSREAWETIPAAAEAPLVIDGPLDPATLVAAVLERSPRLETMRHTWRAMVAMVPQAAGALDPTLELEVSPLAIHMGRGQGIRYRHPIPWAGSLDAKAEVAVADAEAMGSDLQGMQRMLAAAAMDAIWEIAASAAMAELLRDHHGLMATLRQGALGRLTVSKGMAQEVARAEAELAMADRELHAVARMQHTAAARLNALLRRPAGAKLGTATLPAALPAPPEPLETLLAEAASRRPELAAAASRVRAREADVRAADLMTRPMFVLGAGFSTMEEDPLMWPSLMLMIELPFETGKRDGMVEEARSRAAAERSGREALGHEIATEVATRRAELAEALDALGTTDGALLPARKQSLDLAIAAYGAGMKDFDLVVMAAGELLEARLERVDLVRRAHAARAMLDAAVGRLPGGGAP